ncbi:MAG: ABC transporter ATP-binding protein [Desulfurococcales archaeon]|nr:ABC transporter ATP-binding protein [Desulfurococcales archaeon]
MNPIETRNLTKRFGALVAVDNVSITVKENIVTVVIGPNGAGKTTLFNLIGGILKPNSGHIFFYGRDITNTPPYYRTKIGISKSFQSISIFPYLTLLESVVLAIAYQEFNKLSLNHAIKPLIDYKEYVDEALSIIETVGLKGNENKLIANFNQADQRKIDIALAIASKPKVLLLDEPTAGLALEDIPMITGLISNLRDKLGFTVLMVEHKMDVVKELADWIIVMSGGRVITEGTPDDISSNEEVMKAYLGEG